LIREKTEGGIVKFMRKLATSYSMYINTRYDRSGSLFEGNFKSRYVDDEPYMNYLFSYIHLNPVKKIFPEWKDSGVSDLVEAKKYLDGYKYSSYHDYFIGNREYSAILEKDSFPEDFNKINDLAEMLTEVHNEIIRAETNEVGE